MNNILAAKVLMSHLTEITDGAYKTATKIAIETLLQEAKMDYYAFKPGIPLRDYLELSQEDIEEKFGFFVNAFKYGTPPHGGLAIGLERLTLYQSYSTMELLATAWDTDNYIIITDEALYLAIIIHIGFHVGIEFQI